mmetsp:Transcript_118683/g.343279  ORF Transcript_118683/g.343279 Transcript_118683/m.343279 type:complete len:349 (-) Transcript_118683:1718-2764(-)
MYVGRTTSQKSSRFARIKAPATSVNLKRTDCVDMSSFSSSSFSSPSESSSGAGPPRRRVSPGSDGVSLLQGILSNICTMSVATSLTQSLDNTPSPAFFTTPAMPAACACNFQQMSSSTLSALPAALIIAPTVFRRNSVTSSRNALTSMRFWDTAVRALATMNSHVPKTFALKDSDNVLSSKASNIRHESGRKSQKSSCKASISVSMNSSASSISSSTEVLRPSNRNCSSSLSSSSTMSAADCVGFCCSTLKMLGKSALTYGLKSLPNVSAILPAASCQASRRGSSASKPCLANGNIDSMISLASLMNTSLPTAQPIMATHSNALPCNDLCSSLVQEAITCFNMGITLE